MPFRNQSVSKRFINSKDPQSKDIFNKQYKDYRNMLSTLLKKSKTNYYDQYCEANMNNIKNTWKLLRIYHLIFQSFYLPMVLHSQIKLEYQTSLIIILHQLLKKQK